MTTKKEDKRPSKRKLTTPSEPALTEFTHQFDSMCFSVDPAADNNKIEREKDVEKQEKQLQIMMQQVLEREQKCVEKEKEIEARERILKENEERLAEAERIKDLNAAKLPQLIHLNISGKWFLVAKEKLLRHKGSLFEQIIATNHAPALSLDTQEIYIARDPGVFAYVFWYLIHGEMLQHPFTTQEIEILRQEFNYFNLPFGITHSTPTSGPIPSVLLERTDFAQKIIQWLPGKTFQLLYRATEHGFGAEDFHRHCDNNGPTLTLIQSKQGYLFGGYSILSWDSTTNGYKQHPSGFIFTLSNPNFIPPTKYRRSHCQYSIYCEASYGPTFGMGGDIYVASNSNINNESRTLFGGRGYVDTTKCGPHTFTGAQNFSTSEIEVFAVF